MLRNETKQQNCFNRATGFSDLVNEIPNRIETKFATASAGKAFVTVAILQLIEKGDICFTDTLGVNRT